MRKFSLKFIGLAAGLALSLPVIADEPGDSMKTALMAARTHLVAMIDAAEADQAKEEEGVTKATKELDDAITAASADKDKAEKVKEFQTVWEEFKKTRDEEIIPAIKAGKKDDAKALAKGVQAERMAKMKTILVELGAKAEEEMKK